MKFEFKTRWYISGGYGPLPIEMESESVFDDEVDVDSVVLKPSDDESAPSFVEDAIAFSTRNWSEDTKPAQLLRAVENGQVPLDIIDEEDIEHLPEPVRSSGQLPEGRVMPDEHLPRWYQDIIDNVFERHRASVEQILTAFLWVTGVRVPAAPVNGTIYVRSESESEFRTIPSTVRGTKRGVGTRVGSGGASEGEVRRILESSCSSSVPHELLREAFSASVWGARAALVTAFMAVEVGTKDFLSDYLGKEAGWLLENVPTPPVDEILQTYIPKLVREDGADAEKLANRLEALSSDLKEFQHFRNEVVHGRKTEVERSSVERRLELAEEVLWILDGLSGASWAKRHLERTTEIEFSS